MNSANTIGQFTQHMRVYEAVEKSELGSLLKDGKMFILLSSDSDTISVSESPTDTKNNKVSVCNYRGVHELIDEVLAGVKTDFSLKEYETELYAIELKYAYLIYSKKKNGTRRLLFSTTYTVEEVLNLRKQHINQYTQT